MSGSTTTDNEETNDSEKINDENNKQTDNENEKINENENTIVSKNTNDENNKEKTDNENENIISETLKKAISKYKPDKLEKIMLLYINFIKDIVKKVLNKVDNNKTIDDETLNTYINDSMKEIQGNENNVVKQLIEEGTNILNEFTKVIFDTLKENKLIFISDNNKLAGVIRENIEHNGRAIIDGTINAFSAIPIIGNFFSVIRSIHSFTMPFFTIGGGTVQIIMNGLSNMYNIIEELDIPEYKNLNNNRQMFEIARTLANDLFIRIKEGSNKSTNEEGREKEEQGAIKKEKEEIKNLVNDIIKNHNNNLSRINKETNTEHIKKHLKLMKKVKERENKKQQKNNTVQNNDNNTVQNNDNNTVQNNDDSDFLGGGKNIKKRTKKKALSKSYTKKQKPKKEKKNSTKKKKKNIINILKEIYG